MARGAASASSSATSSAPRRRWASHARASSTWELLPNIPGPLLVEASLRLTYTIALIAALAFLGLTPTPTSANWGQMINQNRGGC